MTTFTHGLFSDDERRQIKPVRSARHVDVSYYQVDEGRVKGGPANKDGNTMPLANQEGGGNKNIATSQQDVEAQQEGEMTVAAEADANATGDPCKDKAD
jgi:hypothetical protein